MRISYAPLFSVDLLHGFHADGEGHGDFTVAPLPTAAALMRGLGLKFRQSQRGFSVLAELALGSEPAVMLRGSGVEPLRLAFTLDAASRFLSNYTDLPPYRPGTMVFCFDNLTERLVADRPNLGDSVAAAALGPPVDLETGSVLVHRFADPTDAAVLTLTDRFGSVVHTESVTAPAGSLMSEYRIDLGRVDGLVPGRFSLSDDLGATRHLYVDPELWGKNPVGLVELFAGIESVPQSYRFLNGNVVSFKEYAIEFKARATTWRYVVTKHHDLDGIDLERVEVVDPAEFDREVEGNEAVFTSREKLPLRAERRNVILEHKGQQLRALPNPEPSTAMQQAADGGDLVSAMYVYV
jgi:hypothetical protein